MFIVFYESKLKLRGMFFKRALRAFENGWFVFCVYSFGFRLSLWYARERAKSDNESQDESENKLKYEQESGHSKLKGFVARMLGEAEAWCEWR